jgi:hypothetical protein
LVAQARPALGEEVAHEPEVVGEVGRVELGDIPAGQVGVDAVHERRVVAHLGRQRREQVADALLVGDVDVEVADQHDRAVGADRLTASRELAGLHVALHDVDAVLLVEGDAGDLVEADDVVLGDQAALSGGVVDEHAGDGGLAAGDQVGVRRDLLEQVRLAGAARAQFDHVEVPLHERDHPQQQTSCSRSVSCCGSKPTDRSRRCFHCSVVNRERPSASTRERVAGRELDGTERPDREGLAVVLVSDRGVVEQVDLGVEAAGQHALVVAHNGVVDTHVAESEARQLCDVGVRLRIEPRLDQVDELDRHALASARLEEFLLACPDGAVGERRRTTWRPSSISSGSVVAQ